MTERAAEKIESPLAAWKNRFREDFRFHPGTWMLGVGQTFAAIFYKFVTRLPQRVVAWVGQFVPARGKAAVAAPRQAAKQDAFVKRAGIWGLRLVFRTLDLVSFGEIANFLMNLVKINTRPLTQVELQEARKVFGGSLDYWRIRIDEWSLIAQFGAWDYRRRRKKKADHMAMTLYNTIHFSRRLKAEPGNGDMAWLIHELTHTAQSEHAGGVFMMEALIAQGGAGYDYGGPAALFRRDFKSFNREQQGDIARDYYKILCGVRSVSPAERTEYERMIGQLQAGDL